jgi:glycosyltransferase involved in cell wall biosynthesis
MVNLRVGLVAGQFAPERDGVAAYTARLAWYLRKRGIEAHVVATHAPPGRAGAGTELTTAWDLREVRAAARSLRRLDLDAVHVQFAPSAYAYRGGIGLLPLLLAGGPPLVVTLHDYGWWSWQPRWLPEGLSSALQRGAEARGWWDRETLLLTPRAERVVITNPVHAGTIFERLPDRAERVVEIPVGAGVEAAPIDRGTARDRLGVGPDVPVLVFSGLIRPTTGIPYLLDAAVRLRTSFPRLRLYVVGGFESEPAVDTAGVWYRREVESLVGERALGDNVVLTGSLPDEEVSALLHAADVAVFPFTTGATAKNGSVLAALEHRTPTVATTAEPEDPTLEHERHLLLVPRRDPGALAVAVGRLLTDHALADRLAAEGARRARRHTWPYIADAHVDLYRSIVAERPARAAAPGHADPVTGER